MHGFFPPGATDEQRPLSLWRVTRAIANSVRQAVGGALTFQQWRERAAQLAEAFRDTPRRRARQTAKILGLFHKLADPPLIS